MRKVAALRSKEDRVGAPRLGPRRRLAQAPPVGIPDSSPSNPRRPPSRRARIDRLVASIGLDDHIHADSAPALEADDRAPITVVRELRTKSASVDYADESDKGRTRSRQRRDRGRPHATGTERAHRRPPPQTDASSTSYSRSTRREVEGRYPERSGSSRNKCGRRLDVADRVPAILPGLARYEEVAGPHRNTRSGSRIGTSRPTLAARPSRATTPTRGCRRWDCACVLRASYRSPASRRRPRRLRALKEAMILAGTRLEMVVTGAKHTKWFERPLHALQRVPGRR